MTSKQIMYPEELWDAFQKIGDIDRNGVIDLYDVVAIQKAYDSTPSSPNWDARCDLNGDGYVGLEESIIIMRNYGMTIEQYAAMPPEERPAPLPPELPPPELPPPYPTPPPEVVAYTLSITCLKLPWFNNAALQGLVETAVVPVVKPFLEALGYSYLDTFISPMDSTVAINMRFMGQASPAIPIAAILAGIGLILLGIGAIVVGAAWYRWAEVAEKHEVTVQEAQSQASQALEKGLITPEQYTQIMSRLAEEPPAGVDWSSLLIIGLLGLGAIVVLPKVLPRKKEE